MDIFVIEGPGLWDRVAGGGRCLTYFLLSSQSSYIISVLLHNGMSEKTLTRVFVCKIETTDIRVKSYIFR